MWATWETFPLELRMYSRWIQTQLSWITIRAEATVANVCLQLKQITGKHGLGKKVTEKFEFNLI